MPKYSLCISHYNDGQIVKDSLESILSQLDDRFEVIVVDNFSNDGSEKVLAELAVAGKIKLIRKKSTRGMARQLAFESSKGEYVLAHFDLDDVFNPVLSQLVEVYHKFFEGRLLKIDSVREVGYWGRHFSTFIAPSALLRQLGGWQDVQYGEDHALWLKASEMNQFRWISADLVSRSGEHADRRGAWNYFRFRLSRHRDMFKLGLSLERKSGATNKLAWLIAYLSIWPHERMVRFEPNSEAYHAVKEESSARLEYPSLFGLAFSEEGAARVTAPPR
jgi:glycosyltransferase involved in cell wall biosynthesis